MEYGKKKKMAVGGTTGKFVKDRSRKSGKRFVSNRSAMLKEIDKLKDAMKGASKSEKAKMQKLIDAKKAGIKSTSLTVMDQLFDGFPGKHITNRNYRSPIPTRTRTKMDEDSIEALKRRNVLKAESKREKKAGGSVKKKMAMGGKMKPVDKKKNPGLAKLPTEVRNKMGFMKKGGDVKMTKKERDFIANAFQPKTPKERKAAAIDKVKRENKSQFNQERKKESSRKLKEIHSKFKPGMPMLKKGGSAKKAVTEGMKKAAKTAAGLGAAIAKVKKKQGKKAGGMAKKKMMGGGMAMKYKHGGKTGKCPRDGIAMRGKTKAGR